MDITPFYEAYQVWYETKKPRDPWKTMVKLTEEVGEVAEGMAAFGGSKSKIRKLHKKGQTPESSLKEEIGDVIIVALNLATLCNISHEELFERMRQKSEDRVKDILGAEDVGRKGCSREDCRV